MNETTENLSEASHVFGESGPRCKNSQPLLCGFPFPACPKGPRVILTSGLWTRLFKKLLLLSYAFSNLRLRGRILESDDHYVLAIAAFQCSSFKICN